MGSAKEGFRMFYIGAVWFASALIAMQWFFLVLVLYALGKTFPYELPAALAWVKAMTGFDPLLISFVVICILSFIVSFGVFSKQAP